MSAEQPGGPRFDRRVLLRAAGGVPAGTVAPTCFGCAARAAVAAPEATAPILTGPVGPGSFTSTGNPVVTGVCTADPDAFVYNGQFYLDTDRDQAPLGATNFVMREWHLYATAGLKHWTDHGARLSLSDILWGNANAWAPQMVQRAGKFSRYLRVQRASTGAMTISGRLKSNMIELDDLGGPAAGGGATGRSQYADPFLNATVDALRGDQLADAQAADLLNRAAAIATNLQTSMS